MRADESPPKLSVKKSWAIRYNSEAVSPVIGTILMVSTTVVLVAILFVMVIGFGGNSFSPSVLVLDKSSVPNGYKVQLTEATADVKWGDIIIQLNEGPNTTSWTNLTTADLVSSTSPTVWHHGSPLHLDNLSVFLNITDLSGNGKIDRGDSLTFTTCSSPTFVTTLTYTLTLVYKPTGGSILSSPIF